MRHVDLAGEQEQPKNPVRLWAHDNCQFLVNSAIREMVEWWLTPGQGASCDVRDTFTRSFDWWQVQAGTPLNGKDKLPYGLVTHGLAANDLDIVSLRRIK